MQTSQIDKLLISPPGHPEYSSWSPEAHRIDDTIKRAAYHGLMRAACIADAEAMETAHGLQTPYSVESKVRLIEDITGRS
jgi:hypothetical protein